MFNHRRHVTTKFEAPPQLLPLRATTRGGGTVHDANEMNLSTRCFSGVKQKVEAAEISGAEFYFVRTTTLPDWLLLELAASDAASNPQKGFEDGTGERAVRMWTTRRRDRKY